MSPNGPGEALVLAQAGVSCFLAGLIWVVQIVHYPLFADVGEGRLIAYHARHARQVARVVALPMLAEAALALALLWFRPPVVPLAWAVAGALLVGFLWVSTALVQVPAHARLGRGETDAVGDLVRGNWWRTAAWSARAALALAMVDRCLAAA